MAGDAEQARAPIFWRAAVGVCLAAFQDDRRDSAERLHIVDDGGTAVEANDGGKGRLDTRIAALAFK